MKCQHLALASLYTVVHVKFFFLLNVRGSELARGREAWPIFYRAFAVLPAASENVPFNVLQFNFSLKLVKSQTKAHIRRHHIMLWTIMSTNAQCLLLWAVEGRRQLMSSELIEALSCFNLTHAMLFVSVWWVFMTGSINCAWHTVSTNKLGW